MLGTIAWWIGLAQEMYTSEEACCVHAGSFGIAFNNGGPVSAVWGWVWVAIMTMTVVRS